MDFNGYNINNLYNKITPGDLIKYKYIPEVWTSNTFNSILKGKVVDKDRGMIKVENESAWIHGSSIIHWIPNTFLSHLSLRIVLKNMWSSLIFREIKTSKIKKLEEVHYKYINQYGFPRTKVFRTLEEAYCSVPEIFHRNVHPCYEDYYGFTTDDLFRSNDTFEDQEIFFSRKCHTELDIDTGFFKNERSSNRYPPLRGQYICGLVENGEKGLFFRKWFLCSLEFMTLWTMICQPDSYTMKQRIGDTVEIKSFSTLLNELSTKKYQVDYSLTPIERRINYKTYNFESSALYSPDKYVELAKLIFRGMKDVVGLYDNSEYRNKFYSNVMWMLELI